MDGPLAVVILALGVGVLAGLAGAGLFYLIARNRDHRTRKHAHDDREADDGD